MFALEAEIRKFTKQALGAGNRILRMTGYEGLAVTQIEPASYEISRSGHRFFGGFQNGSTGRAPTATWPTTTAQWMLYNGESQGGAAYAIEMLALSLISGTPAAGGQLLIALTPALVATAPTAATGYTSVSASRGRNTTKAIWAENQTLTAQPTWLPVCASPLPATATPNGILMPFDLSGKIIVPPQYALAIHYFSGAGTTPLYGPSAMWCEIETELE